MEVTVQPSGAQEFPVPFACTRCGIQFAASPGPPERCPICDEARTAAFGGARTWTTMDDLKLRYENIVQRLEENLFGIRTIPTFANGQRAMLVRSPGGSLLWDCTTLVDDPTIALVRALGAPSAIAVSHPRHAGSVVEWSHAFGGVPVYVHATGEPWMMRPDPVVRFWTGTRLQLQDGLSLAYCGGQDGGTVLHWPAGSKGTGALLTGGVLRIADETERVSLLLDASSALRPRSPAAVQALARALDPFAYERLYDAFERVIASGAQAAALASAARGFAAAGQEREELERCRLACG
jgi:hypothetical protein